MIDLGSNSGRVEVVQPHAGGHLEIVEELRLPLRLGAAIDEQGHLNAAGYQRLASAIEDFLAISRAAGAERVVAVGTAALRDASNGPELLERLRRRFGLEVSPDAPVVLVGNSMGGLIVMLEAARHPDRVSHLVLVRETDRSTEVDRRRPRDEAKPHIADR